MRLGFIKRIDKNKTTFENRGWGWGALIYVNAKKNFVHI